MRDTKVRPVSVRNLLLRYHHRMKMEGHYFKNISNFFVAGINYKKSDASIRGQFAISNEQYERILQKAADQGLDELFILSTCNRTEIYGFAYCSGQLAELPFLM